MAFDIILIPFLQLCLSCIQIYKTMVFIYIIISLLLVFNIINRMNTFIYSIQNVLAQLIEPVLSPIKRILPKTRMFDFSLIVLILFLQFITSVINMTILKYFHG
jgi:YggT family protein